MEGLNQTLWAIESLPAPDGAPLGYGEFYLPYAERTPDEWRLLWKRLTRRDGTVCWYCQGPMVEGSIDHVVPRNRGGSDHLSNLRGACRSCNAQKGGQYVPEGDEHTCCYPALNPVYGRCLHCGRRRSKNSRKVVLRRLREANQESFDA